MANISVKYLGLSLKNPIIASSSGLTSSVKSIVELEKAGVAAVVLKSLFEEQMMSQATHLNSDDATGEGYDYLMNYVKSNSVDKYLTLISESKKACKIPIIASINCYSDGEWSNFASQIEKAGADALELNIFYLPTSKKDEAKTVEEQYLNTVSDVVKKIKIPVSVKMSSHFTNPLYIVDRLYQRGAKGIVMFNRLYQPDIDVKTLAFTSGPVFSTPNETADALRWIALSSVEVDTVDYAASTGVHSGEDMVKMLLAGATAVQICSVLYNKGNGVVKEMLSFLESWLKENNFLSVKQAIGYMNSSRKEAGPIYERAQFMKYYSNR